VVERLADAGSTVVAVQRSANEPPTGASTVVVAGDLSSDHECQRAFAQVGQYAPSLSGLVNLAGGFEWEKVADGELATWDRLYSANLKTALNACKAAVPLMEPGSAIVNIGAAAAHKGELGIGAYTASKSAVARLTESLAAELKPHIRVNAVLPSIIDTATNRGQIPNADFSKWVTPLEVANVIAFLLSDKASGVTGALVPITGPV
jgi:NAD(P)-dependent dehydrogenase (short-subunit alcohol dehydrogenase family)